MNRLFALTVAVLSLLLSGITDAQAQQLAFPGADGYGKYVTGGRGGKVYYVTRTDDCSDNDLVVGTLRWALQAGDDSPRVVMFQTSGTIYLTSKLKTKHPNVSILGQTAPGGGVCIAGYNLYINKNNYIVRHVRFRAGDIPNTSMTGLDIENADGIILDHCSITWSMEECLTAYDTDSTTVQWCIIGEGLYSSKNAKGSRAYATQWGGEHSTMHHTLITNSHSRSPRFNGVRSVSNNPGDHDQFVDSEFANNVVFNWSGSGAIYGGENYSDCNGYDRVYMINNYYRPGPSSKKNNVKTFFVAPSMNKTNGNNDGTYGEWYLAGNKFEVSGSFTPWTSAQASAANDDNSLGVNLGATAKELYLLGEVPYALSGLQYESAEDAYAAVTTKAGASLPRYDEVDQRLLDEAAGKVAPQYTGSINEAGIIDSPDNVSLAEHDTYYVDGVAYTNYPFLGMRDGDKYIIDTDGDGMPDAYEDAVGLDKNNVADGAAVASNGYTNLENYVNGIADGTLNKADYETSDVMVPSGLAAEGPTVINVSFSTTGADEGVAPKTITQAYGTVFTAPINNSIYKEGYTLTAWTDGTHTYKCGDSFTPTSDLQLRPVFTKNSETLSDRTKALTVTWDFTTPSAPTLGNANGIYVVQQRVNMTSIDVRLAYTPSTVTVPAVKGAEVTVAGVTPVTTVVENDVTAMTVSLPADPSEVSAVSVLLPFVQHTGNYHSPVCAEGEEYEIFYTTDANVKSADWVSGSYSVNGRYIFDPVADNDDANNRVLCEGSVVVNASNHFLDAYVTGVDKVKFFIAGSASVANYIQVTAIPNDGSDNIVATNASALGKGVSGTVLLTDLNPELGYRLHCAAVDDYDMFIGAIKLFKYEEVASSGVGNVAWAFTGWEDNAVVKPEVIGVGTASRGSKLATKSKESMTAIGSASAIDERNENAYLSFKFTPNASVSYMPTAFSFDAKAFEFDTAMFDVSVKLGNGEEQFLATGVAIGKDVVNSYVYSPESAPMAADAVEFRIYLYGMPRSKYVGFQNVLITGVYEGLPTVKKYPVHASAVPAEGGTILQSPSGSSFEEGKSITFMAKANPHYVFEGWTLNGRWLSPDETVTVEVTNQGIALEAGFRALSDFTDIFKEDSPYDAEVRDARTLLIALQAAQERPDKDKRYRIFLHNGSYILGPRVKTSIPGNTSLIGELDTWTVISNHPDASTLTSSNRADATPTLFIDQNQNDVYLQDITIRQEIDWSSGVSTGQAMAMRQRGKRTIYKNVSLNGIQDTYYLNKADATAYFETSAVCGGVDFIYGDGTAWFEECILHLYGNSGYITAPNTQEGYRGFVFNKCDIGAGNAEGAYYLGRPWGDSPAATYLNCAFLHKPKAEGWANMTSGCKLRFHEYGSVDYFSRSPLDLSSRSIAACMGTDDSDNPVLTEEQAAEYTLDSTFPDWNPKELARQLSVESISLEPDGTVTWSPVEGAYCYAVLCNSRIIAFTFDTSYVADREGYYTVRVANQMGGLGPESAVADGIESVKVDNAATSTATYDLTGKRVGDTHKGIVVKKGRKEIR